MPNSLNLDIYKSSSASWQLNATDSAGAALNLSGFTLSGILACNWGYSGILLDLNPTFVSATGGVINISISGSVTSTLPVTQAVYSIYALQSSGIAYNFLRGYVNIHP